MNFYLLFAYRVNFINSIIASIGWGVISILSMFILTSRNTSIYGWTRNELLLLSGVYSIVVALFHAFFARNFDRFSRIIHLGQLDLILLKPIDAQFNISFTIFHFTALSRLFIALIFSIWMLSVMHIHFSFLQLIFFIMLIFLGVTIFYGVWFLFLTITIWFSNLSNIKDFLYNFNNLGRYPSEILFKTGNVILLLFLPLTYVASVPVKVLLTKATVSEIIIMLLFAIVFFVSSRKFWQFALRFYTSASG